MVEGKGRRMGEGGEMCEAAAVQGQKADAGELSHGITRVSSALSWQRLLGSVAENLDLSGLSLTRSSDGLDK